MSHTPFERELLREVKRTNELLEALLGTLPPQRIMQGMPVGDPPVAFGQPEVRTEQGVRNALAAAGILPMTGRRPGKPETPEQRAERFAARAREVGLSEEAAAEVSGRVQLDLDNLTPSGDETVVDEPAPRKRAARKPR